MPESSSGNIIGLVGPEKKLVVHPERRRRVNLPLPTKTASGIELPPINIEPIAPGFLVRSLPEEEANAIFELCGRKLYTGKPSAQDIGQIIKLPKRVKITGENGEEQWKIPGWPEDRQDAQEGDIFVSGGVAHVVRTNWGPDNQVLFAQAPHIIVCWVCEGDYEYDYVPLFSDSESLDSKR